MGIINITPDSFFEGSRCYGLKEVLNKACCMVSEGADIIDIGGVSTRPGSNKVSLEEEQCRVIPAVKSLRKMFPNLLISVDTFRADIADKACSEGCNIINDISGGLDNNMYKTAAHHNADYVLTHYYGNADGQMEYHQYGDVVDDVDDFFVRKIEHLRSNGVKKIILDPGFGFSKNINENYSVLKKLSVFKKFNLPILVGLSRKSMIYNLLSVNAHDSLNGTSVLNAIALLNGADILRVHDVKEACQVRKIITIFNN